MTAPMEVMTMRRLKRKRKRMEAVCTLKPNKAIKIENMLKID
jgi:hypothetical protein